jgi:hypothetical protein
MDMAANGYDRRVTGLKLDYLDQYQVSFFNLPRDVKSQPNIAI